MTQTNMVVIEIVGTLFLATSQDACQLPQQ